MVANCMTFAALQDEKLAAAQVWQSCHNAIMYDTAMRQLLHQEPLDAATSALQAALVAVLKARSHDSAPKLFQPQNMQEAHEMLEWSLETTVPLKFARYIGMRGGRCLSSLPCPMSRICC